MAKDPGSDHSAVAGRPSRSARELAARVVFRVAEKGAFASRALDAELSRSQLNERDGALATEIVYGTLRVLPALDACYGAFLRSSPDALDPVTRAVLRTASYQLQHLSRVPPHAVVDESVALVSQMRGPKLGGLVNAVLRKVAQARPAQPAQPSQVVVPPWVHRELLASLGEARTSALLDARQLPPPIGLRVRADLDREAVMRAIAEALPSARIELGRVSDRALLVWRAGDLRKLAAFASGQVTVQEEGSQWIARYVDAQPGERIADLCAGHGGKTTYFAERVGDAGSVLAVDLDDRKLELIAPELERIGVAPSRVETRSIDLSRGTGGLGATFDRVLLDAACTGLGTLHRRPDLLLRVAPEDPARLGALQLSMLHNAAKLVREGGVLVYSVCSPTHAEARDVVMRFAAAAPDFVREHTAHASAETFSPDEDGVLRIGPWSDRAEPHSSEQAPGLLAERSQRDSPDAYQLVLFRRVVRSPLDSTPAPT
jgi:16S rRNA (cytosine967-C5)-methyltransferase